MALYNEKLIDTHIPCPYCDGEGTVINLGKYLSILRKQSHLSQVEMGSYSGYSRTQIQSVERGLRNPSPMLLESYQKLHSPGILRLPIVNRLHR
jgi:DNA-binding XRE family transcriptional regulator